MSSRRKLATIANYTEPPLNFSFLGLTSPQDALDEAPRIRNIKVKKTDKKYNSNSLLLNNNHLSDYVGLNKLLELYFFNPTNVAWLDLSFNHLSTIGEELCQLPLLQILYFHGNQIARIHEVSVLEDLKNLRSLTLHGNPIEMERNYRSRILMCLPDLRSLDFSDVTSTDLFLAKNLEASFLRLSVRKRDY